MATVEHQAEPDVSNRLAHQSEWLGRGRRPHASSVPASTDWPPGPAARATTPSRPARSSFSIFIASMTTIGCRARTASPLLTSTRTTLPGIGARSRWGPEPECAAFLFSAGTAAAVERDRHDGRPDVDGQLTRHSVPCHGHLVAESAAKPGHSARTIRGPAKAGHYAGSGSVRLQADLRALRDRAATTHDPTRAPRRRSTTVRPVRPRPCRPGA